MVRSARLKLGLLAALVAIAHVIALEWVGRQADKISGMPLMAPPMYTRLLKPAKPPPVVHVAQAPAPQPKPRAAPRPKPPASSPAELRRKREQLERQRREAEEARRRAEEERRLAEAEAARIAEEEARREAEAQAAKEAELLAQAAREAELLAQAAAQAASAASAPAAAASEAKSEAALLDERWPTDTRLTYRLSGEYRGPLFGDARVQWQREAAKYQVRLDVRIQVFGTQILTSQGEVTPDGLIPRAYEELRPGKRRFAQIGDQVVTLESGRTLPRPPGVQDTASQFVELAHRFATGKEVLEVGRSVSLWLARPGAVDQWTYDVVAREMLQTPKLGTVETFHLKPRPIANPRGNITAEMWFAPSLQYLPVRIKVVMGNEAWLDLLVDHIEQK